MIWISTDESPHFGEVWKWQDMGPYMAISLHTGTVGSFLRCWPLTEEATSGNPLRLVELQWDIPGRAFRRDWHRIDEGELV